LFFFVNFLILLHLLLPSEPAGSKDGLALADKSQQAKYAAYVTDSGGEYQHVLKRCWIDKSDKPRDGNREGEIDSCDYGKKRVLYSRTETVKAPGIIWSKPLIK
jgi:hypothetical protein